MVAGVPVFKFGVIADVQYAYKDDGNCEARSQYYKSASKKLGKAIDHFNTVKGDLAFVLSLGDCIDGNDTDVITNADLEVVASEFGASELQVYHAIGNHCLSVPREVLQKRLGIPSSSYYVRNVAPGWRLVVLDTTQMSKHSQHGADSELGKEAADWCQAHAQDANMKDWNGGLGHAQREWLQQQLSEAEAAGDKCIVAAHHPIGSGAGRDTHKALDCKEVEAILNGSPAVVAVFSGHDHVGAHACVAGVHYIVPEAMLEAPEDSNAYGIVSVLDDHLEVEGFGVVKSRTCRFRKHA